MINKYLVESQWLEQVMVKSGLEFIFKSPNAGNKREDFCPAVQIQ